MLRKLETVQRKGNLNRLYAIDEPGPGGANHAYVVVPALEDVDEDTYYYGTEILKVQFQKGARNDMNAIDGVLGSDLLEIVRDTLRGFQSGEFACEYNEKALEHIERALYWLNKRVEDRIERQVLGIYER